MALSGTIFGTIVSVSIVILGTFFFGDFSKPVRRYMGKVLNIFNDQADPEIFAKTGETVVNVV